MQCLCKILFNAADSIVAVTRDFEWCFDIELSFGRSFVDGRSVQALPLVYLVNRAEKISFVIRQSRLVNSLPTSILYSHKFHKLCLIELSQEVLLLSVTPGVMSPTTRYCVVLEGHCSQGYTWSWPSCVEQVPVGTLWNQSRFVVWGLWGEEEAVVIHVIVSTLGHKLFGCLECCRWLCGAVSTRTALEEEDEDKGGTTLSE